MEPEVNLNNWGSHLGLLFRAVQATKGTILEIGVGCHSTPMLHGLCNGTKPQRELVSLEEDKTWFLKIQTFKAEFHLIRHVVDWDRWFEQDLVKDIGVVLVDHGKWGDEQAGYDQRVRAVEFYANRAEIVVVHDVEHRFFKRNSDWAGVVKSFKYVVVDTVGSTKTAALSNWVDVR